MKYRTCMWGISIRNATIIKTMCPILQHTSIGHLLFLNEHLCQIDQSPRSKQWRFSISILHSLKGNKESLQLFVEFVWPVYPDVLFFFFFCLSSIYHPVTVQVQFKHPEQCTYKLKLLTYIVVFNKSDKCERYSRKM